MPGGRTEPDDLARQQAEDIRLAQEELLGAALMDATVLDQPYWSDRLLDRNHLPVLEALRDLRKNGTTPQLGEVSSWLRQHGWADHATIDLLRDSMLSSGPAFAPRLAERIRKHRDRESRYRSAIAAAEAIREGDEESRVREHLEAATGQPGPSGEALPQPIDMASVMAGATAEPVPWAVHGLFAKGDLVVIGGEGGTGKSIVALDLALAIATGQPFLGLQVDPSAVGHVLYLDEENKPEEIRRRIRQHCNGRNITEAPGLHYYLHAGLDLSERGFDRIRRLIDLHEPRLVVLDAWIRFVSGSGIDENDNTGGAVLTARLRAERARSGVGWGVLAHLAKPSKERPDAVHRIRGASELVNSSDALLTLEGDRTSERRTLTPQQRRTQILQPMSIAWRLGDDDNSAQLVSLGSESGSAEELVLRAVQIQHPNKIPRPQLVSLLEANGYEAADRTIRRVLARLAATGILEVSNSKPMLVGIRSA